MKCECAARWSLTAINRVHDNSTPEGLRRRAGLHDFGLPVFSRCIVGYCQDRAIPTILQRSRAVAVGLPDGRPLATPHLPLAPSVGSPFGAAPAYINRRRITRQRQNEIVNFKICMTCRITAAWIGIDAKVYMMHGTIDFMLTCLIS